MLIIAIELRGYSGFGAVITSLPSLRQCCLCHFIEAPRELSTISPIMLPGRISLLKRSLHNRMVCCSQLFQECGR